MPPKKKCLLNMDHTSNQRSRRFYSEVPAQAVHQRARPVPTARAGLCSEVLLRFRRFSVLTGSCLAVCFYCKWLHARTASPTSRTNSRLPRSISPFAKRTRITHICPNCLHPSNDGTKTFRNRDLNNCCGLIASKFLSIGRRILEWYSVDRGRGDSRIPPPECHYRTTSRPACHVRFRNNSIKYSLNLPTREAISRGTTPCPMSWSILRPMGRYRATTR